MLHISEDITVLKSLEKPSGAGDNQTYFSVYTRRALQVYDWVVLGISARLIGNCNVRALILAMYRQHISTNHLDIGPGSGYFLDHALDGAQGVRLVLSDIQPNCIVHCMKRLSRFKPSFFLANIVTPFTVDRQFASIGLNFVLHCVPGTMHQKLEPICHNIAAMLQPDGVFFGSTAVGKGGKFNSLGKFINNKYNDVGIFSNLNDDMATIETVLKRHFKNVQTNQVGTIVFFSAVGR